MYVCIYIIYIYNNLCYVIGQLLGAMTEHGFFFINRELWFVYISLIILCIFYLMLELTFFNFKRQLISDYSKTIQAFIGSGWIF